jgi:hypothetical protein
MKNIKLLLLFVILISTILPSCKKGENDPFLTLRARKARITGEWRLTSGLATYFYNDTIQTLNYFGSSVAIDYSTINNGTFATENVSYSEKWTIKKDNSFIIIKNFPYYSLTITGLWNFGNKDKKLELKNKESIEFKATSKKYTFTGNNGSDTYTYSGSYCPIYIYSIDQLKNKEIIVKFKGSTSWTDHDEYETGNFTFQQ